MIVISDSNIIFSALIKPTSLIGSILKSETKIQLVAPKYILEEVNNHFDDLVTLTKIDRRELKKSLKSLIERITFIEINKIPKKYIVEAVEIVADIDYDDFLFVAINRYKHHKIWTGDKVLINGLLKKGYDICITTAQLKKFIYKK